MGLDMYLKKRHYVKNWKHTDKKEKHKITITKGGKKREDIDTNKISYIIEDCGYWRKANAIHKWFVDNNGGVDNCEEIYIDIPELEDLLDRCDKIIKDHTMAKELLPTNEGFFFGNQEYDEQYLNNIKDTKKIIKEALKSARGGAEIYYQASW